MAATVRFSFVLARGGLIGLVFLVLWIWALVDVIRTPDSQHRGLPKPAWFFIVLLFSALGAMAWIAFGRPRGASFGFSGGGRRLSDARDDAYKLSERERAELERREYYKRMDEELDRRLEEKRREEGEDG